MIASFLERRFALSERGTTPARETLAGLTTFLAAAYLIVVIPSLLSSGGMDRAAVTAGVILVMAIGSLAMAFYANLPFIVGPGIGGSAILGITLAQIEGVPWQTGLGIAAFSGIAFIILTLTGARGMVVRIIPPQIKLGLGASIGLFIAMLGCRDAGLVSVDVARHALKLGDFGQPGPVCALIGLAVAIALQARRVPGAVLAGIIVAALVGVPLGLTRFDGVFSLPHSPAPVTGKVDMLGAISLVALPYMFTFFASEFFSTLGTTLAIGGKAGLTDKEGNLPQIERPFLIDSLAATLGPLVGVPGGTALVESAAGVEAGGRTGMTPMVAAILFAATLLAMPLAMAIPREATAPALILIGIAMMGTIRQAPGEDTISLFAPIAMMLLTLISNSFGTGIAGGLLVHVLVEVLAGRWRQIPVGLFVLSLPLGYYFYTAATLH
ncbi:NCS2 family permease [Novosphingobium sp. MBES04]|uniref:NCS2 family permease n=1 Tax=Novosphingobium sp. MBES04 TaxID=1206458 RepID=UPI00057E9251|nr:NCS2 family permease [Novosphingobium sp. MBES04]GAM04759.1 xanthine/uracil/vitamin C permease [Novosphingobium sp. MBES04]